MQAILKAIHPVLMVPDVKTAIGFYRRLGFALSFQDDPTAPQYAVLRRDGVELHMQWQDQAQWSYPIDRPAYRFLVADADALYAEFIENGAVSADKETAGSPWHYPADSPWGTREFHLRDPGHNSLQFYHPV